MIKTNYFLALTMLLLSIVSCSVNDGITPFEFKGVETLDTISYRMANTHPIGLEVQGSGFTITDVTSNNPDVIGVTRLSDRVYDITATTNVEAQILFTIEAESGEVSIVKSDILTFYRRGIVDNVLIDGITVGVDDQYKLEYLLGEPEEKFINNAGTVITWKYFKEGVSFNVSTEESREVASATAYAIGATGGYSMYQYTINNDGLTMEGAPDEAKLSMDTVVEEFGEYTSTGAIAENDKGNRSLIYGSNDTTGVKMNFKYTTPGPPYSTDPDTYIGEDVLTILMN